MADSHGRQVYKGFPHGMATTHADAINADLLAFLQGVRPFRT
ncbi:MULTISPECIES: hypothetical protein [unclassified Mesorhizobium]